MSAVFSPCGQYRYVLNRDWQDGGSTVAFVMLNPSTADATQDDPTIRRCIGFAKRWGFHALTVVNLFAWRATDPKELRAGVDRVGHDNDDWIRKMCSRHAAAVVVCAWGVHGSLFDRGESVRGVLSFREVCHLGLTKGGHPKHPLYLPGNTRLQPWPWTERPSVAEGSDENG